MALIKLLADQHIFLIERISHPEITLTFFDSNLGLPERTDADVVLVRTVTPVTSAWLDTNRSVKFVGTASAGFDHLDILGMEGRGIQWGSSPGCNAQSVAEFVLASLVFSFGWDILDQKPTVGIIGVGNAGGATANLFKKADFPVILYDPPREKRDPGFKSVAFEDLFSADILTVHVPLSAETRYLVDQKLLSERRRLAMINAARGGILNESHALVALKKQHISKLVVDVWENEPVFSDQTANETAVSTPHIAGYSYRAKINATRMVTEKMLAFFKIENSLSWPIPPKISVSALGDGSLLDAIHPIRSVHTAFQALKGMEKADKKRLFHELRQAQNQRPDWQDIHISHCSPQQKAWLTQLGISASHD